jgi:hypothetical protein
MRTTLHILTSLDDALARGVIDVQKQNPDSQVSLIDLTRSTPDYKKLLEAIFEAESIEVW